MDIQININKNERKVPQGTTVNSLLEHLEYSSRAAVWVNDEQLLQSDYPTWELRQGDKIKIIRLVAGG